MSNKMTLITLSESETPLEAVPPKEPRISLPIFLTEKKLKTINTNSYNDGYCIDASPFCRLVFIVFI